MTAEVPIKRTGAALNRHGSKHSYGTPVEFIDAVAARFGPLTHDLAASHENKKALRFLVEEINSLTVDWHRLGRGLLWLNPPFGTITPWAAKCAEEADKGARIALLVPASVDSVWFMKHVHRRAHVAPLIPRLTFVGQSEPYPKGLLLAVYGIAPTFEPWRWRPLKRNP